MDGNGSSAVLAKGTILVSSWGYEQTNRDFYEVLADATVGKFVALKQLESRQTSSGEGAMCGHEFPILGSYKEGAFKRKLRGGQYGFGVMISSYEYASVWDGKPASCSWWH